MIAKMWNEESWENVSRPRRDEIIEHTFLGDWKEPLEVRVDVSFAYEAGEFDDSTIEAIASVITQEGVETTSGEVALQARGVSREGVVEFAIARALHSLARAFEKR